MYVWLRNLLPATHSIIKYDTRQSFHPNYSVQQAVSAWMMLHVHLCIPSAYLSEMLTKHPGYSHCHGWVSIVTSLQMEWPRVQFPARTRDLHPPRFLTPGSKIGWGVEVTTHLHLMLRSRKSGFMPPLPIASCAIMVWTGTALRPQARHAGFTGQGQLYIHRHVMQCSHRYGRGTYLAQRHTNNWNFPSLPSVWLELPICSTRLQ
jgi:hypothetical protein